jgi:hypothetical protein
VASTLPHLRATKPASALQFFPIGSQELPKYPHSLKRINAPAVFRYWHLVSLDAPTVAIVWPLAFAWAAHTSVPAWMLLLEALVVWAAYVGDRLLDARRSLLRDGTEMRDRHWFHWRHRRILVPCALAAIAAAACIACRWMPVWVWRRDSLLGLASVAYFARVHGARLRERLYSKELLVGVLFTAGCALPAASWTIAVPIAFFAALAWLNCSAIENWESAVRKRNISGIAVRLSMAGFAAGVFSLAIHPRAAILLACGAASAALLAMLDHHRNRLTPLTLRTFADLVLLTPALVLASVSFE